VKIQWDESKNQRLAAERGVSFEIGEQLFEEGDYEIRSHPNPDRYPNQILLVFPYRRYMWVCPATLDGEVLFLKTIYPSRKYHRRKSK